VADPPVTTARIDFESGEPFQRIRRELGVESFGLNALTLRPGQRNRVHVHSQQEEVYLVLEGELTLVVEGEDVVLSRGMLARVAPSLRRQLTNRAPDPVVLLALGGHGKHQSRDALAWTSWEETGEGRPPQEVPLPDDLPSGP
jgi:uncharacterized cupin superfamily protein